jgi:hypothetical protein
LKSSGRDILLFGCHLFRNPVGDIYYMVVTSFCGCRRELTPPGPWFDNTGVLAEAVLLELDPNLTPTPPAAVTKVYSII